MKVLGTNKLTQYGSGTYIVEMTHKEYAALMNKHASDVGLLTAGQEVDLATAYDFTKDISRVCKSFIETQKDFTRAHDSMVAFANLAIKNNAAIKETKNVE